MTDFVNAIGLFSTLLTTIGFIQGNIPTSTDPKGATVAIEGRPKPSQITLQFSILRSLASDILLSRP